MNYINIFNNIITIISFIANIFFLIPFLHNVYKYFSQNRYIKKVLGYNKESIQIYQSTFEFNTPEGYTYDFITYNSLEGVHNIINLFNIRKQKYTFINQIDSATNEMCIGGFLTNKRVNSYFSKYFTGFKYYVDEKYKIDYEKYPIDTQIIEYSKGKTGFKINNDVFLETEQNKKDYAFLVKLTNEDFKTTSKRIVHILFGGRSIGTIKATEYLTTQYKEIYKKYKDKHYFFAIEINLIDNSFNNKIGIIDLTDKMFNQ